MMRTACLSLLAAVMVGSVVFADPSVVRTRDGASFEGEVVEKDDSVIVTIRGVDTVIPKSDVASIDKVGNIDQELQAKLARLDPREVNGRILLAREAFGRNRYELARDILSAALVIDANNRDATDLLEVVNSHIRMERAKADSISAPAPAPVPVATQGAAQGQMDRRFLTPADIEAIRRKEIKANDTSVRLRFEGDVKRKFAESQGIAFPDFNMLSPLEQAGQILVKGDESLRSHVRIMTDPESIQVFRRQVQPLVVQGCATTGCHGASPGGGFMLYTTSENDVTTYTNFYILQSYKREDPAASGVFSRRELKLISRGHGEQSLLANYGLPPAIGDYDHPPLRGGRILQPLFRNRDDVRYKMLVAWMNSSLAPFEPDYGILYTPPMPTTVPSRQGQAQ